jgi:alpha-amylase
MVKVFGSGRWVAFATLVAASVWASVARAGEQPVAIFHAFDQRFADVEGFVCTLAEQGYSHVQITPVQRSNPSDQWWARYQPIDYAVIDGKGSEGDLSRLIAKAHGCGVKVIADVVFNHMADAEQLRDLKFPGIGPTNFHSRCPINYQDGNRTSEVDCWLGTLPDLNQDKAAVMNVHKRHIRKLLSLGIDGFRFDAAKHMPVAIVKRYVDYVDAQSQRKTWNYLEVIEDDDTPSTTYTPVAAVTDFRLYRSLKAAFSFGGDLRSLRVAQAVDDPRSVVFGRNHDTIKEINEQAIDPYADRTDSYLATAFVLAHESGTPLVLNWDNADVGFIRAGVKFRQIMRQRGAGGGKVKETVLGVIDSPTLLVMERGSEGLFVVNKATAKFDIAALDMTLTNIEGCYRELRNRFLVAVEKRGEKKFVTRWGTRSRGGMAVEGRDALYFIREPWSECQVH